MLRRRRAHIFARLVGGAALCACSGWGPTERITGRYVYGTDSSGTRTAIVATYIEQQAPTGLAKFPDGGSPRILKRGMLVYLCSVLTGPVEFLGFVPRTDQAVNVDVRVLSWQANGFDAAFRDFDVRPPVFSAFHIDLTGIAHALGTPTDTVQASQAITPTCQHTVDSLNLSIGQRTESGLYDRS